MEAFKDKRLVSSAISEIILVTSLIFKADSFVTFVCSKISYIASFVFWFTEFNSSKISIAVFPASRMALALVRSFSTSVLVSSIILPIIMTFSVAVCVSLAWEDAPSAISDIAFSTCSTDCAVSDALTSKTEEVSWRAFVSVDIVFTALINSLRKPSIERPIIPVSSFLLLSLFWFASSLKSRVEIFSINSIDFRIGFTIMNAHAKAMIMHKAPQISTFVIHVFAIALTSEKISFSSAVTTRI